jgi:EF hand
MIKQLKRASVISVLALSAMTAPPVAAQSPFPSSAVEFSSHFWTDRMMKAMDQNKDGMVSRQEFMTYMGNQYDMMDTGKKGMLTGAQFTDRKMMARTFTFPASPSESGQNR